MITLARFPTLTRRHKDFTAEKVGTEFIPFHIILTTPEGDVKDLTDIDDRTPTSYHETQWPEPATKGLLDPIDQFVTNMYIKEYLIVQQNKSQRFEMSLKALKADEMNLVRWTLFRCGKQVKKLASPKGLRQRILHFARSTHQKGRY